MDKQSGTDKSNEKHRKQSQTKKTDEENNKQSKTEKSEEDNNLLVATRSSKTAKSDKDNNLPIAPGPSKINLEIDSSTATVFYSLQDINENGLPSTDEVAKDTKAGVLPSDAITYNVEDIEKQPKTEINDEDNNFGSEPWSSRINIDTVTEMGSPRHSVISNFQEVSENIIYWDDVQKYIKPDFDSSDAISHKADSQATLTPFVDLDETLAGPYRRKSNDYSSKESLAVSVRSYRQEFENFRSKENLDVNFKSSSESFDDFRKRQSLVVRVQQKSEAYKLVGGERHYYRDCSFHFPQGVGKHRQFDNVSKMHHHKDTRYTVLSSVFLSLFILFFDVILYDQIQATFNMNSPLTLLEQPFLSFAPVGFEDHYRLIHYNPEDKIDVKDYSLRIVKFLKKLSKWQNHYKRFGPCQMNNRSFGYETNEPCVFLKINRIIGFQTEPFDDPTKVQRPLFRRDDYERLKFLLTNVTTEDERKNRIWINCASQQNAKIDIYPEPFIKTKYVDQEKVTDIKVQEEKIIFQSTTDLNRVVALKISNIQLNIKYKIKCKMFALNIKRNRQGYGKLYFYVKIDKLKPHLQASQEKT